MNTRVYKNPHYGWMAESTLLLDAEKNRYLEFVTMKRSSGAVSTTVKAVIIKDHIKTMEMFGDYFKTIDTEQFRATEKLVAEFHTKNVELSLLSTLEEAKVFYSKKGE